MAVQASYHPGSHNVCLQPNFLALPAELRNAIYAYALSTTSPLLYRPSRYPNVRGAFYEAAHTRHFNQLKHVNRQLRTETEDLEIQYNEVAFEHNLHPEDHAPELLSFTCLLPPGKLQWLTKVILQPPPPGFGIIRNIQEMFKAWEQCATHFQDYPQIAIKYKLPLFGSAYGEDNTKDAYPGRFIKVGMILVEVVRGHDFSYLKNPEIQYLTVDRRLQKNRARDLEKRLPNFRIFPDQDELSALWIRNAINDMPRVYESRVLLQRWILVATEWRERGI